MFRPINIIIVSVVLLFLDIKTTYAQGEEGDIGITAAVQDLQFDFYIPYWLNDRFVIAPSFGFTNISKKATDLVAGLALRYHFPSDKMSPYVGFRFAGLFFLPDGGDTITDYLAGIFGGAEYFLDPRLSIGGELQINGSFSDKFSDRFGNPDGKIFNSATTIFVTFYFK